MPVYEIKVPGQAKARMVKAKDVSAALAGLVEIKAIGAERMLELQDEGVALEKIADPNDPASYAPGGALHGKEPPPGVTVPEVKAPEEGGKSGVDGKDAGKAKE